MQLLFKNVAWIVFQPFFKLSEEGKKKMERRKCMETPTYSIILWTETGNSNNVKEGTDYKAWIYHQKSTTL